MHCKFFFGKTLVASSGPKRDQKTPKIPKLAKITLFALYLFIHPTDLYEILPKCGGNCYEHKNITAEPGKTLVRVPRGLLVLKTPILGAFPMFSKMSLIAVFYSADFKFTYVVT